MDIWHVDNKEWTTLRLWRMYNDNFRVIEAGVYKPLLFGADYNLIDKKYSWLLQSLGSQVTTTPVKIHDFLVKSKNDGYIELKVLNQFDPDTINKLNSSGLKIWTCYGTLFVSGDLKAELTKVGGSELFFSLGFSMIGGINANSHNLNDQQ